MNTHVLLINIPGSVVAACLPSVQTYEKQPDTTTNQLLSSKVIQTTKKGNRPDVQEHLK